MVVEIWIGAKMPNRLLVTASIAKTSEKCEPCKRDTCMLFISKVDAILTSSNPPLSFTLTGPENKMSPSGVGF